MVMVYKTKQEKVISLEALNQAINQEEEEDERQIKEEKILQGASSVSSPERQAEPEHEEPSPGVTQEVPEL
jgi:hypothetical protein